MERWINVDEAEDVAASIRHAIRCHRLALEDEQAWKWMALALHAAIQGACVCHLVTTAVPVGVVSERNAAEWVEYFEKSRSDPAMEPPATYLLAFPELLKNVRKPYSAGDRSNEKGIPITDEELAWLKRFHSDIRNQFVHFSPQGWSIEVSGIPELGKLIARVINDILEVDWAFRHKECRWKEDLKRNLETLAANRAET